jgi:hypothetical protein
MAIPALMITVMMLSPISARARFESGTFRFGAGLGLRGSDQGAVFSFGASGGVFVLKGFDLGLSGLLQTGGEAGTLFLLAADVRFIPFADLELTPYLKASGGRLFVEWDDAWMVSAGGGLLYMFGPWYGIDLSVAYRWLIYPEGDPDGNYDVQVGVLLLF